MEPLELVVLDGPAAVAPLRLRPGTVCTIGRGRAADLHLPDHPEVSRAHARIADDGTAWTIEDLGSRNGTEVDGRMLPTERARPLGGGSRMRIGPWLVEARLPSARPASTMTIDDAASRSLHLTSVQPEALPRATSSERLHALIDAVERLVVASDTASAIALALEAVLAGSSYDRAGILQPAGGADVADRFARVEIAATLDRRTGRPLASDRFLVSRSLLRAAEGGGVVRLEDRPDIAVTQAVLDDGTKAALCLRLPGGADHEQRFLYLDSIDRAVVADDEAASFAAGVARVLGLALERLAAESRRRELQTARDVQETLMPPARGTVRAAGDAATGFVHYEMRSSAGREVAGDLFGILPTGRGRVAAFLGDVSGKGAGPALLMASTLAYLNARLGGDAGDDDAAAAMAAVDRHLVDSTPEGMFVTLWLAVIDPASGEAELVTAGHDHAVLVSAGGAARDCEAGHGSLAGIPGSDYEAQTTALAEGDRLVVFSDGVLEQPGAGGGTGDRFGRKRVHEILAGSTSAADDVDRLLDALRTHAGTDRFHDDVTVASIEWRRDD